MSPCRNVILFVERRGSNSAHLLALDFLDSNSGFNAFNLGNGRGYSVRQVINATEQIVGRKLNLPVCGRRSGDPATLVASSDKARTMLGWKPRRPEILEIVESAWKWHQQPQF